MDAESHPNSSTMSAQSTAKVTLMQGYDQLKVGTNYPHIYQQLYNRKKEVQRGNSGGAEEDMILRYPDYKTPTNICTK